MFETDDAAILATVRSVLPEVRAVYVFGTHGTADKRPDSDIDIAVALRERADPVTLWTSAGDISVRLDRKVDLVDLLAAPTTLQYEIITKGRRLLATDSAVRGFEDFVLKERRDLEQHIRRPIIDDILARGRVHG